MRILFAALVGVAAAAPVAAQIEMGHIQLNVSDIAAQRKFWISQFDAKVLARSDVEGVRVPGMLILFTHAAPTHLSEATVLDHFGFKVRSRDEMVKSCREAGYVISKEFTGSEGFPNAYVVGPDGVTVELQEDTSLKVRAVAQHLHFLTPDYLALRSWYVDTFGMTPTHRGTHDSADIPGMNLTFAPSHARSVPSKGGIIDHIGFEVADLQAYCGKPGITCRDGRAFLTDPAGISIELTHGLGAN